MAKDKIFYGWFLIPILGIIYLINVGFPVVGASVTNTYMAKALNLGRGTLGLGFTVCFLIGGFSSPLIAFCIKKKGVRFTLVAGCLSLMLGSLLMALAVTEGWQYVVVFGAILGMGSAFGSMLPVSTGVTLWFKEKKALAMSIAITVGSLGGFMAPPILNKIISLANGNWRMAWFFIVGLLVLSIILTILFVKNTPADLGLAPYGADAESPAFADSKSANTKQVYRCAEAWQARDAIKTVTFWLLFVASVAYFAPMMIFMAHAVIYLRDMGHTPTISAMAMSYYMFFSLAGRLLGGTFGDRFEPRYIWAVGLLLEMVGILCFLEARSVVNIYLFAFFVGIGVGAASICMPTLLGNYFGANSFAPLMGILLPIVQLLGAAAPFLAGLVYDVRGSYLMAFIVAAVLAGIGSVVIFFTKPPKLVERAANTCPSESEAATAF